MKNRQFSLVRIVRIVSASIACLCLLLAANVFAIEISKVKIEPLVTLANKELVLNGAGLRSVFFTKVYVAALYLPTKTDNPELIVAGGPRKMVLHVLRDIEAGELASAMLKGMRKNNTTKDLAEVTLQMSSFGQVFATFPMVKNGDTITFDYVPGIGSSAYVNKTRLGEVMPGDQFARVFFRIWLGDHPVQDSLKRDLLGVSDTAVADKTSH
ncbi:MAG: chalcone isomerase family protein [Pseudomonadota bacterium]